MAALEAINAEMKTALQREELDAWARADDRFHRLLIDGSGNLRLAPPRQHHHGSVAPRPHDDAAPTAKPTKSLKEHQSLVAAIKSGDGERSCNQAQTTGGAPVISELLPLPDQFGIKHL